jgi:hypothetical protein
LREKIPRCRDQEDGRSAVEDITVYLTCRHLNTHAAAMPAIGRCAGVCVERIEKRGGQPVDTGRAGRPEG